MASRVLVVDDSPTIRRVVCAILERHGYEAAQAADGESALAALADGTLQADLILLDFVMPKMNGYQFCRELRANVTLATTPVVLMSAKSDRIRDQFVEQTGAIDAIAKPFDAQALVCVVENALRRVNAGRASSALLPDIDGDEPEPVAETETLRTHVAQIVATKLVELVTRALAANPGASPKELTKALSEVLVNEAILEMVETVRNLERSGDAPGGAILTGDLGVVPIGAVLQLLQAENQTGLLTCRSGSAEVLATFRGGLIDLVQSNGAGDEFRLGRFLIEEGILTPSEIDETMTARHSLVTTDAPKSLPVTRRNPFPFESAPETLREDSHARVTMPSGPPPENTILESPRRGTLENSLAPPRLLGTILLEAGKVTEAQLRSALTRQSSELLYEVIRWPKGRFEFRRRSPSDAAIAATLGMPVVSAVMEGFRRVDEWRVLERTLGSFHAVLMRDDVALGSLPPSELPPRERVVLDAVDGKRAVRDVIAHSHMSSFDACRVLVQFLEARVLRRRIVES